MSLRSEAIEAMARQMFERDDAYTGSTWESDPGVREWYRIMNRAALDALCDYLSEHADEWKAASHERLADTDPDVFGAAALAALARGDTREDTE